MMTSRERMMRALNREKPDRLPVTVHQWQPYYLDVHLGGIGELEAFERFGMDAAVQCGQEWGQYWLRPDAFARFSKRDWRDEAQILASSGGEIVCRHTITTPGGVLTYQTAADRKTVWVTEFLIKNDDDIELIRRYMPVPALDRRAAARLRDRVGDKGILRGFVWGDQGGCWQHAACLIDPTELIYRTYDKPAWVHELLGILLEKKLRFIETMEGAPFDVVETGGGASSTTLISPAIHEAFCLPYDRKMHDALQALGFKAVYHTCGGTRGIEEMILANGAGASETLAPKSIGGNSEPWEFKAKTGGRIALIGGMDQFNVLTGGSEEQIRRQVRTLFEKVGCDGGYILSCADHFFETPPRNLEIYAAAARECAY